MPNQQLIKEHINKNKSWWHHIDINGVTTPGITAIASQQWISSYLDKDMSGMDVLDIGTWDGYYSFLCEKRGANKIIAIDPHQGPCSSKGFKIAHQLLDSKVDHQTLDVYQLNKIKGQFDRILFFGVYYHLDDPMLALYRIFQKLKPGGKLIMEGLVRSGKKPYLYTYRPGVDMVDGDFCAATVPWLTLALERVGFDSVNFESRYAGDNLLERPIRTAAWYLNLHAGRLKKCHRAVLTAIKPTVEKYDANDTNSRDAFLANYVNSSK